MDKSNKNGQPELSLPLPSNIEAERSVLGSIILDNATLTAARELLTPEDFFLPQHTHIFYQMLALHDKSVAIELVTLTEELQRCGDLESAGGTGYISALADGMPRVSNIAHYAKIVKEKSTLRAVIHSCHNIQQHAFENEEASVVMEELRSQLTILNNLAPQGGPKASKIIIRDNFEQIEKIFSAGKNITGLATGYGELDRALAGLQPSELVILAARPSVGKSALALNIVENISVRAKAPSLFFSLEMSEQSLLVRLLASVAQINAHKFRTGHLGQDDYRRLTEAMGVLADSPLWIDDSSAVSLAQIAARAERLKQTVDLKLIVVDYLQLVAGARDSRRYSSRQEEVSSTSRGLKALAKDLKLPVLALSQLTRHDEERPPQLSDLRESGAIEQDADVVLFIYRPNMYKSEQKGEPVDRNETDVIIGKQRNGPTDTVKFIFRDTITRFEEAAPDTSLFDG